MRYTIANNLKLKDIEGKVNQKFYDRLIEKKAPAREEDIELQKSMIRTICKTDEEEEVKRLLNNMAPYLRNKVRPFLFMVGEKEKIRSEIVTAINRMMIKSKVTPSLATITLEVSVSGDTLQIDQTNVTINIDDTNPIESFEQPES